MHIKAGIYCPSIGIIVVIPSALVVPDMTRSMETSLFCSHADVRSASDFMTFILDNIHFNITLMLSCQDTWYIAFP